MNGRTRAVWTRADRNLRRPQNFSRSAPRPGAFGRLFLKAPQRPSAPASLPTMRAGGRDGDSEGSPPAAACYLARPPPAPPGPFCTATPLRARPFGSQGQRSHVRSSPASVTLRHAG